MRVGFTGTRFGCTQSQLATLEQVLRDLAPTRLLHGCCTGADEQTVRIARSLFGANVGIVALPGESARGGENEWFSEKAMDLSDEVRATATHFARNRQIVEESDVLVACPPAKPLPSSGGTVYTIGVARKRGVRIIICWPDGSVSREG